MTHSPCNIRAQQKSYVQYTCYPSNYASRARLTDCFPACHIIENVVHESQPTNQNHHYFPLLLVVVGVVIVAGWLAVVSLLLATYFTQLVTIKQFPILCAKRAINENRDTYIYFLKGFKEENQPFVYYELRICKMNCHTQLVLILGNMN